MRGLRWMAVAAVMLGALSPAGVSAASAGQAADAFNRLVTAIENQPYQAAYAPNGNDSAFPDAATPNTLPAEDYTSGSIPGTPDTPNWPSIFRPVSITSPDGAYLTGELAMHPGSRPAVLVVHGFNTHGDTSVIRWAAMLAASGYDVLAADQRDFFWERSQDDGKYPQTFGWKESQDVVAAGRFLASQPGVTKVGIVGFSEGAQNTLLALAADAGRTFGAGLTFSAPADQDTQIYSTAAPPNCKSPACAYPATDALVSLVVPHEAEVCTALSDAATAYGTTAYDILAHEDAMHAQRSIRVPLLNFYANDDPLVAPFQAQMMASYTTGPVQRTILIQHGAHAYFYDRWWQQRAILMYFRTTIGDSGNSVTPTVNQAPGGTPLRTQEVSLGNPPPSAGDAQLAPFVCDTSRPSPAATAPAPNPCAAIAAAEPRAGHTEPPAAPALFAPDFPVLSDCEWGYRLGGYGGLHRGVRPRHTPVIFVHGNQADAENWFSVMDRFRAAGYTDQELYALSYNGLENAYAGMPVTSPPSPSSTAYWENNPQALANGGTGRPTTSTGPTSTPSSRPSCPTRAPTRCSWWRTHSGSRSSASCCSSTRGCGRTSPRP